MHCAAMLISQHKYFESVQIKVEREKKEENKWKVARVILERWP
jgi:hypothetical protein